MTFSGLAIIGLHKKFSTKQQGYQSCSRLLFTHDLNDSYTHVVPLADSLQDMVSSCYVSKGMPCHLQSRIGQEEKM